MRLSAGLLWFLSVGAAVLIGAVLLSSTAPKKVATPCQAADAARDHGRMKQAQGAYAAILADDPASECANQGLRVAIAELCLRADTLAVRKLDDEARERYVAILAIDAPASKSEEAARPDVACAVDGLAGLIPTPTPTPARRRPVIHVHVQNVVALRGADRHVCRRRH
jgi:hypothetical protein